MMLPAFDDVKKQERKAIDRRRQVAFSSTKKDDGLIGLAISGGGLRSAVFNLGLLQAFRKHGLFRYIDYIASVSGGGYLSGYLSSVLHHDAKGHNKTDSADGNNTGGSTKGSYHDRHPLEGLGSGDRQQFADCGRYLARPVLFAAQYLLMTIPLLALFGSGLLAVAFLLAVIWRCFDYQQVRDHLNVIDWSVELFTPFLPTLVLVVLWLMLVVGSRVVEWFISLKEKGRLRCIAARIAAGIVIFLLSIVGIWGWQQGFRTRPFVLIWFLIIGMSLINGLGRGLCCVGRWVVSQISARKDTPSFRSVLEEVRVFLVPGSVALVALAILVVWLVGSSLDLLSDRFLGILTGSAVVLFLVAWGLLGTERMKVGLFRLSLFSPLIGLVLLISNGYLSLDYVADWLGLHASDLTGQRVFRWPLLIFVIICLLGLFRYRSLLHSRRPEATIFERIAFHIVIAGIILGIPLAMIGRASRENISGYATYRDPYLIREDIRDWRALADLCKDKKLPFAVEPQSDQQEDLKDEIDRIAGLVDKNVALYVGSAREDLKDVDDKLKDLYGEAWTTFRDAYKRSASLETILALEDLASTAIHGKERWDRKKRWFLDPRHGWLARAGMLLPGTVSEGNPAAAYTQARLLLRDTCDKLLDDPETGPFAEVLGSDKLTQALATEIEVRAKSAKHGKLSENQFVVIDNFFRDKLLPEAKAAKDRSIDQSGELERLWRQATDHHGPPVPVKAKALSATLADLWASGALSTAATPWQLTLLAADLRTIATEPGEDLFHTGDEAFWSKYRIATFNRRLLEVLYPNIFKPQSMISTPVVIGPDQTERIRWCAIYGLAFLILFLTLPINQLSPLHRFYRSELESEFLRIPGKEGSHDPVPCPKLAELKPW